MHRYINYEVLRNFSETGITVDSIFDDLDNYEICGYADEDSQYYIAEGLFDDYALQRSNYKSYIEKGLKARMLMELRLSSLFRYEGDLSKFWEEHRTLETPQDVIDLRIKYGRRYLNPDYVNYMWQNHFGMFVMWKGRAQGLIVDYEPCYEDCKYYVSKSNEQYIMEAKKLNEPIRLSNGNIDWNARIVNDHYYDGLKWINGGA